MIEVDLGASSRDFAFIQLKRRKTTADAQEDAGTRVFPWAKGSPDGEVVVCTPPEPLN